MFNLDRYTATPYHNHKKEPEEMINRTKKKTTEAKQKNFNKEKSVKLESGTRN